MDASRILIVENEEVIAEDIKRMLTGMGYEVTGVFPSGASALESLPETRPDLILMDIRLDGSMDGIETSDRLRVHFSGPIVFITAYVDDETIERAKTTEPFGYIIKPVREKDLHLTIEFALEKSRRDEILHKNQDFFKKIIEQNADGIVIVDHTGKIRYVNPSAERFFGRSKEDLNGAAFGVPLASEEPAELTIIQKNGVRQIGEMRLANIDYENEPAILLSLRNVTERKNMEADLSLQRARIESIFNYSPEAIATIDMPGAIVSVNPAFEKLFGCSSEEIEGANFIDLMKSFGAPSGDAELLAERAPGGLQGHILQMRRKDGAVLDLSVSLGPIRIDEDVNGYFIICRNVSRQKQAERDREESYDQLQKAFQNTVDALASAVEIRDPYTAGHQQRVAKLAGAIGENLGLDEDAIKGIRIASAIHDIGKIQVPAEILSKPTKLTDMEFNIIKLHPQVGYDLLKGIDFPWPIAQIVHQHHERLDGSGYPQRLVGEAVCTGARVLAVADVVEAMASHRPYRPAIGIDAALDEIDRGKGRLYDERAVEACRALFRDKGFQI